ncbi:SRPBCC family protein [Arthrobacter glacialis]|uniref:Polyketide cyclase n=1 Tax=Arthrobacter glacialis TaxID=1664 RepID=A0A2S3ZZH2_ARTGL|nr:SRPBCC domain-containing protein [Arthrobacter glacialis]POH59784.1 polyketide cyclase [Arthrobacter glacialis]POH74409.1 polyketide cyclase [Arthrobacter glacialis]
MTVVSSTKNPEALSFTIVSEFAAGVERVWQIWADPRQLERWWGPPTWPATFEHFDFKRGGKIAYFMTGPDGEKARGWWHITAVAAPHMLELDDGFADENGDHVDAMGVTRMTVTLEDFGDSTRMTVSSVFETAEQMEQMIAMGMEEGMGQALGQIDAILAGQSVS